MFSLNNSLMNQILIFSLGTCVYYLLTYFIISFHVNITLNTMEGCDIEMNKSKEKQSENIFNIIISIAVVLLLIRRIGIIFDLF